MSAQSEWSQLRDFADPLSLPYAHGGPLGTAQMRVDPADFDVTEQLPFEPGGQGEHLFVRICKRGHNTRWVAEQLAALAALPYRAVSYAGLKDRHAVARQWFSLQLAGRADPDFAGLPAGIEIIEMRRHHRKLRQGQLDGNAFRILLRDCRVGNRALANDRLEQIAAAGVPNYFGPQRFGRAAGNLDLLGPDDDPTQLSRGQRGFALSALRAALFNGYVAERVRAGNWNRLLEGELAVSGMPRGPGESGLVEPGTPRLPGGILWGRGRNESKADAHDCEQNFFGRFPVVTAQLERAGARLARRALSVLPDQFRWDWRTDDLKLSFTLPPGAFATAVLREVLVVSDHAVQAATDTDS